jgi:hypothetical protein
MSAKLCKRSVSLSWLVFCCKWHIFSSLH